jgi:hypothetical protein
MAHLPPEVLSMLPTLPHAAARLSREKFHKEQQQRDDEEGLTAETLGLLVQPPDPPEESTEPTPLPPSEIQFMSRQITGIRVQRGRRSFKRTVTAKNSTTITSIDFSNTALANLILRVIRLKRQVTTSSIINQTVPTATSNEQTVVTIDPSTITSSARVAGGMRIPSPSHKPPKRKRTGVITSSSTTKCKRAKPSTPSTTVAIPPILPSSGENSQLTPWNYNRLSSVKRKHPPSEITSNSPKRQCLTERQEPFSIPTPLSEKNSTDLIDFNNIDLFKFNFNVCVLPASAEGDSQCDLLASVPMEAGNNDIFNFTSIAVSFNSPADSVSGMGCVNVVLPVHDTNVCVLASPVALELASAVD